MARTESRAEEVRHEMHPVFKGATRPAMVLGVPVGAFIAAAVGIFLPAIWVSPLIAVLFLPALLVMRRIARKDDYRFHQLGLALSIFPPLLANRALWGGFMSLSPFLTGMGRSAELLLVSEPRRTSRTNKENPT